MADKDWATEAAKFGGVVDAGSVDWGKSAQQYGGVIESNDVKDPSTRGKFGDVSLLNSPAAGLAETAASMATGTLGQIVGGYAGIGQGIKNLIFDGGMPAGERASQVQNAMTMEPRTESGKKIAGFLESTLGLIPKGAEYVGEKVAEVTGSPAIGAGVNTALQAAPMLIGGALKAPVSNAMTNAMEKARVATSLAAPKTKALMDAKQAGLIVTPTEANPTSALNRTTEGFVGQSKLQKVISAKNTEKIDSIARADIGLRPDQPLNIDTLNSVRAAAGQKYDSIRGAGEISIDPKYYSDLDAIASKYQGASKSFKNEASPVETAVKNAKNTVVPDKFDASAGIDQIKIERSRADRAFASGDTELGKAHKSIADAIEGQIDRHLKANNATGQAVAEFQQARQLIAKTYDIQKSLVQDHVDARKLVKAYEKGRLTGGLAEIGQFAKYFPAAAQVGLKGAYVPSAWEMMGMGAGGAIGLIPHALSGTTTMPALAASAALAARPVGRAAMATQPYQAAFVRPQTFGPGLGFRATNAAVQNPEYLGALATLAAQQNNNQ